MHSGTGLVGRSPRMLPSSVKKPRCQSGPTELDFVALRANLRMECVQMQGSRATEVFLLSAILQAQLQYRSRGDALVLLRILASTVEERSQSPSFDPEFEPLYAESLRLIDPAYARAFEAHRSRVGRDRLGQRQLPVDV